MEQSPSFDLTEKNQVALPLTPCHRETAFEAALTRTWINVGAVLRSAAGISARLGELLLLANKITPTQLSFLLSEQKRTGEKIGVLLIRHDCLSDAELQAMLAMQNTPRHSQNALKLGNILLALGKISQTQLDEALQQQARSGKLLGDFLHEAGYVAHADVQHGLNLQRRLQASAIATLLSFASLSTSSLAYAEQRNTAIGVSAVVLPHVQLKVVSQTSRLRVSKADIARGYVEVTSGSQIDIKSNCRDGYVLAFSNLPGQISSVQIFGLDGAVEIGPEGGNVVQRFPGLQVKSLELSYRFNLSAAMQPGDYQWPVHMSARTL